MNLVGSYKKLTVKGQGWFESKLEHRSAKVRRMAPNMESRPAQGGFLVCLQLGKKTSIKTLSSISTFRCTFFCTLADSRSLPRNITVGRPVQVKPGLRLKLCRPGRPKRGAGLGRPVCLAWSLPSLAEAHDNLKKSRWKVSQTLCNQHSQKMVTPQSRFLLASLFRKEKSFVSKSLRSFASSHSRTLARLFKRLWGFIEKERPGNFKLGNRKKLRRGVLIILIRSSPYQTNILE